MKILVMGAAGFIGHHLCNYLTSLGHQVRAVDYKPPSSSMAAAEADWRCDMRRLDSAMSAAEGCEWVERQVHRG